MNIPRTKPLVRHSYQGTKRAPAQKSPDGQYSMGLHNPEMAALVGEIVAGLPHCEEQMIGVMAFLLGHREAPARQVFRSLHSEDARVKVMRALLEMSPNNKDKGQEFGDIIDLFVEVKKRRNAYAHGLWSTHESGRVFLAEPTIEDFPSFMAQREILKHELLHTIKRMGELVGRSISIIYAGHFGPDGKPLPSPDKPLQPPTEEK